MGLPTAVSKSLIINYNRLRKIVFTIAIVVFETIYYLLYYYL